MSSKSTEVWAYAVVGVAIVCGLTYCGSAMRSEEERTKAILGAACIQSGGSWEASRGVWECKRGK